MSVSETKIFLRSLRPVSLFYILAVLLIVAPACGASGKNRSSADSDEAAVTALSEEKVSAPAFNADSAYSYVGRQVSYGPRVPNSEAHRKTGDWLVSELKRHGAQVTEQTPVLTAFDGTKLRARNIFGRFNPEAPRRLLLLAHWDCRPWADEDPDPARRTEPVDGANDGASGVGVLLEVARNLKSVRPDAGVDILFVDAEDWGTAGDDESWALGAKYFASNLPGGDYSPEAAILLDMVGGEGAVFPREYFSQTNAPALTDRFWEAAAKLGYGDTFPQTMGSAVTDDHVELLKAGIPTIDIIDYREGTGFCPQWHTTSDNMSGISRATLGKVGRTLMLFIKEF